MRTTLTLEPEIAARLKALAHQKRTSFKATVNEVLRRGLSGQNDGGEVEPFVVEPHSSRFRPGIDAGRLNQLADDLEAADFVSEVGRVILPDLNLLIYAYNTEAPRHADARAWWEALLSDSKRVSLPWAVSLGFVRLMTHPKVLVEPMDPGDALDHVRAWLRRPNVEILDPGPRHLELLDGLLDELGVAGALTTDAHLAALAIEHNHELHSNDADFARFSGLRWFNPLAAA